MKLNGIKPTYKNGFYNDTFSYDYNIFNKDIEIIIDFYFFKDRETYLLYNKKINNMYGYNGIENKLYLTIIIIDGFIAINTFTTKIAHELKHLYQIIKTKRSKLNNNIYYLINKGVFINGNKEESIFNYNIDVNVFYIIRNIVYLSSKYESEAYISELYNELCELNPVNYYEVIEDCNSYKAYKSFINDISFIRDKKYINEINYVLSFYNLSYDKFLKKSLLSLEIFKKKIWKAVSLFIDNKQIYMEK